MSKSTTTEPIEFRVWVEIERYDPETDEYSTEDSDGGSAAVFYQQPGETEEAAYRRALAFANSVQDAAEHMADGVSEAHPEPDDDDRCRVCGKIVAGCAGECGCDAAD